MPNETSPLAEARPTSLDELFSRDPLDLQDQDISIIITELRKQRALWAAAEAQGKTRAPKGAAPTNLTLDDLEL